MPGAGPGAPTGPPPALPGFQAPSGPAWEDRTSLRARMLQTWAALRGRVALAAGPTADRWSTNPGDGLTPELIVRYRREANAGYPWRWADLCEEILERNGPIKSFFHFRRAWIHQTDWSVDPPPHFKSDDLSKDLAAFQAAVLAHLRKCWTEAMNHLLSCAAYGYSSLEVAWEYRTITFKRASGDEISIPNCLVPVWLEPFHQKHWVFDTYSDKPLVYLGQTRAGAPWPKGKFVFSKTLGDGVTCRRGFMTAAAWMEYAIQNGWTDLLVFMHLYGIPQFALMIDKEIIDQEEEWGVIQEGITNYGQGQIPVWLKDDAAVERLGEVVGAPMHPEVIRFAEERLSLLIVGSTLAQMQGTGTGSYGHSTEHATSAHIYRQPDGQTAATDLETHLLEPLIEFNIDQLAEAFKVGADQIRARNGQVFGWKAVDKAPTVTEVIGHYQQLSGIGYPCSKQEISRRTGYALGEGDDRLEGEPTRVPAGEKVVGAAAAAEGVLGPPKPEPQGRPGPQDTREMERSAAPQAREDDPGVMIALYPAPELARELALPGGEAPEELHVTLAYLGRRSEVELRVGLDKLAQALRLVTSPALQGVLGGVGRFSASETSDGKDVVYASVDVPGLVELRQAVLVALDIVGAEASAAHGFTPHLTLQYVDPAAENPLLRLAPRPVRFTDFYLVVGGARLAFPLKETP